MAEEIMLDGEEIKIDDIIEIDGEDKEVEATDAVSGEVATVPVEPGDQVVIALTAQESKLISEVKDIKEGKLKPAKEDIVDVIDKTLQLDVPAVDGAIVTVEIPEDADADALSDINLAVGDDVMADILTLVEQE